MWLFTAGSRLDLEEKMDGFLVNLFESPRGMLFVISPKAARGRLIPGTPLDEEEVEEVILENIVEEIREGEGRG